MHARTKISVAQSSGIALALLAFIAIVAQQVTAVVGERDSAGYRARLENVLLRLDVEATALKNGGLAEIPAYVQNSQQSASAFLQGWSKEQGQPLSVLAPEGNV